MLKINFGRKKTKKMTDFKGIKETFKYLGSHENRMTPGQFAFIASTKKYFTRNKLLSERQFNALMDIKKNLTPVEA